MEVESPTKRSFSTPIETQIKSPIIELPFLFIEDDLHLKAFSNKLVSNFDNFLAELKSSSSVSNIEDAGRKRVASERLFSEWAFKVAHDKCM